jgi:hypothetical protein
LLLRTADFLGALAHLESWESLHVRIDILFLRKSVLVAILGDLFDFCSFFHGLLMQLGETTDIFSDFICVDCRIWHWLTERDIIGNYGSIYCNFFRTFGFVQSSNCSFRNQSISRSLEV